RLPPLVQPTPTTRLARSTTADQPRLTGLWVPQLDAVLEALGLGEALELLQRVVLDLADPLAGDAEGAADLLERARLLTLEPEPKLDHLPLARRERGERVVDVAAPQRERRRVERRLRLLVLDEVPELGLLLLADRLLQRDRQLRHAQDLPHLVRRHLELGRDLVRPGLAPEPLDELPLDVHHLVQLLDHVDRNANRPGLVGDRPRHRLPDPPGRVRRELVALPVVELLDGADQAER